MTDFLFHAHSGTRYLVFLAGLVALLRLANAAVRGRPFDRGARVVSSVFTGLLDLQVVLGLLLLTKFTWYGALTGHVALMLTAAVGAHVFAIAARRNATGRGTKLALTGVVMALVLILAGIRAIGRPWF